MNIETTMKHSRPADNDVNRKKCTQSENKIAMECSLRSEPEGLGYRKRLTELRRQKDMVGQRLMEQIR